MWELSENATLVAVVSVLGVLPMLPLLVWLCVTSEPWDEDYVAARPRPPRSRRAGSTPDRGDAPDSQAAAPLRARQPPRCTNERARNPADASAGGAAQRIEGRRKQRVKAPVQAPRGVDQQAHGGRAATKSTKAPAAASSSTNATSATWSSRVSAADRSWKTAPTTTWSPRHRTSRESVAQAPRNCGESDL